MYGDASLWIARQSHASRRGVLFRSFAEQRLANAATITACSPRSAAEDRPARLLLLHWRGSESLSRRGARPLKNGVKAGKIRSWGVSNFDADDPDDLRGCRQGQIACTQVRYHLKNARSSMR